jgi:hypothetical protein
MRTADEVQLLEKLDAVTGRVQEFSVRYVKVKVMMSSASLLNYHAVPPG